MPSFSTLQYQQFLEHMVLFWKKKKVLGNAPGLYCRGELRTEKHMRIFSYFIFFFPEILAPELSVEVFILC